MMEAPADLLSLPTGPCNIVGIGIDVEEIERFRNRANMRLFSAAEQNACSEVSNPAEFLAGCWCVKEAVVKALSSEVLIGLRDVRFDTAHDGSPVALIPKRVSDLGLAVEISLAHTSQIAIAIAVATFV